MNLVKWIIFLLIIQIGISFVHNTVDWNANENNSTDFYLLPFNATSSATINDTTDLSSSQSRAPTMWQFLQDPTQWSNSAFLSYLLTFIGIAGVVTLGIYLVTKSDTVLFAPLMGVFVGFGGMVFVNLYGVLNSELGHFACTNTEAACPPAILISVLIVSPLVAGYIFTCLEWWGTRRAVS